MIDRICAWCGGPIRRAARRDAITCSKACRQAKSRFRVGPAGATAKCAMNFAYADPPYPGMARKYYGTREVDHVSLLEQLQLEYPDGWALSTSSKALRGVLPMCPAGVRVCSWTKGRRASVAWRPSSAWEPLIVFRGRARRVEARENLCDALVWGGRQHSYPGALIGMKPAAFCEWMFRQLGALAGDTLVDLFPGSGAVGRAWEIYASPRGPRDASDGAGGHIAGAGDNDTSARAARDTSPEVLCDTRRSSTPDTCLAGAERRLLEVTA